MLAVSVDQFNRVRAATKMATEHAEIDDVFGIGAMLRVDRQDALVIIGLGRSDLSHASSIGQGHSVALWVEPSPRSGLPVAYACHAKYSMPFSGMDI